MLFFDTSALVERYVDESGTENVDGSEQSIVVTVSSVIGTTSALRRKQSMGELSERLRDDLLVAFFREATDRFALVPVGDAGFEVAFAHVLEGDLRTLDALQLGTALELAGSDLDDVTFVCADRELVAVAAERGLPTIDPTDNG